MTRIPAPGAVPAAAALNPAPTAVQSTWPSAVNVGLIAPADACIWYCENEPSATSALVSFQGLVPCVQTVLFPPSRKPYIRIRSPAVPVVKLPDVTVVDGFPRSECPALPSAGFVSATL